MSQSPADRINDWDFSIGSPLCGAAETEMTTRAASDASSTASSNEPGASPVGEYETKASGAKDTFATGYQRDCADGKGLFEELPFEAISELARLFERGAKRYGKSNWRKGAPLSRYCNSMLRHGFQATAGYEDEAHFIACAWNALCAFETRMMIRRGELPAELDDLAKPGAK
jgi:hypothetical protein